MLIVRPALTPSSPPAPLAQSTTEDRPSSSRTRSTPLLTSVTHTPMTSSRAGLVSASSVTGGCWCVQWVMAAGDGLRRSGRKTSCRSARLAEVLWAKRRARTHITPGAADEANRTASVCSPKLFARKRRSRSNWPGAPLVSIGRCGKAALMASVTSLSLFSRSPLARCSRISPVTSCRGVGCEGGSAGQSNGIAKAAAVRAREDGPRGRTGAPRASCARRPARWPTSGRAAPRSGRRSRVGLRRGGRRGRQLARQGLREEQARRRTDPLEQGLLLCGAGLGERGC